MKIDNLSTVNSGIVSDNASKAKPVEIKSVEPVKIIKAEKVIGDGNKVENEKNVQQMMTDEMMKKSIKQANVVLKQYNRKIDRSVHDVTKTVMYKMVDTETKKVIKEFPPKKIQDMIAKMWELAGLFVDEQV
jgi:flagellar protein FlaG